MRVAFINQAGAQQGGAEESLTLLLRNLPSDIDPVVVLFEDGDFANRLREYGFCIKIVALDDKLRAVQREQPSSGVVAMPNAIWTLRSFLRREQFDLVHTNTVKAHLIGAPAARLCGIPAIMHVRDMVEGLGRLALRGVAVVCAREQIAISRALAEWYALPHTTVVSNPVDLSQYAELQDRNEARRALGIPADGLPLVGIVGRINRWKGHDRFLRAVASVDRHHPIRCVIVGEARFRDTDFVPELHELARDLGIADRTTFIPWQSDPRLAYAALDVHCNCSEREPFGRTIVEAAAAGVPTIAFDDGGAADIIKDGSTGFLVPAGNVEVYASKLLELITRPEIRLAAGRSARAASARFSASTHALRVATILRRNALKRDRKNLDRAATP